MESTAIIAVDSTLLSGRFQTPNFRPGETVQNRESPRLSRRVDSTANITAQRILLEKQADWLICQGQGKIVEGCKGMFSILCMHFFIAHQARITLRNWGLSM